MSKIKRGYKVRIYPNRQQRDLLARSFGCTRFLWNELLGFTKRQYELSKVNPLVETPKLDGYDFVRQITQMKIFYPWLSDASIDVLQQRAIDLGKAYKKCFRDLEKGKLSFPKFKKKSNRQSIRLVGYGFRIRDNKLYIAKSKDPIKVKWHNGLPSNSTSCTISQTPSREYYASFVVEIDPKLTNGTKQTGLDLGIKDFAVLSDGERIENNKFLIKALKSLKRKQQSLSKKQLGSKNRNKARIKVAKLHQKVSNQRSDFLHKLSRRLVNENQVLVMENLNVTNMVKNHNLARSIFDVGWGTFLKFVSYKALESRHCNLILVDTFFPSSKLCSHCHTKYEGLKLSERKWTCQSCGTVHDRDSNASTNIKNKGTATYQNLCPTGQWSSSILVSDRNY